MLTATVEQNGQVWKEHIFVIDCHSHLGYDVDEANMMNPLAPGTGTFDFWGNVQGKLTTEMQNTGDFSFKTVINGNSTKITWSFTPYPFTDKLYSVLERMGQKHADLKEKSKFYTFIDQGVVFPFQDKYRDKHPEALYRASNVNVSRFATRFPFSLKLIGYCRVDPMEGQKAVKEVKYAREILGCRGLKLHPRSEGWIDNVNSPEAVNVCLEAARHSMPIIFDTRGKRTIMDIGELIKSTRSEIRSKNPQLLPHFKVIIAHFAQGNIDDEEVYNTIVQPNTWGDLSMLHGVGASNFLDSFRNWFISNRKESVDNRKWSEYLLFGSDYPYFGDKHAEKLLIYIVNKQFFDNGGTIEDTRNILGLNQIKVLPEYNLTQIKKDTKIFPSTIISNPNYKNDGKKANDIAIEALANLINANKIDVKNFCVQFTENWNKFDEDILLTLIKNYTKEDVSFLIKSLDKDNSISLLAPMQPNTTWNKFGYKYFNPEDRAVFANFFKSSYLATDLNKTVECLSAIF